MARHECTATEVNKKSFATILLSPLEVLTSSNNGRVHLYSLVYFSILVLRNRFVKQSQIHKEVAYAVECLTAEMAQRL